jgi:hypothetical protein
MFTKYFLANTRSFLHATYLLPPQDQEVLEQTFGVTSSDSSEPEVFHKFLSELKAEATKNGEEFNLTDAEAREFYELMQEEFLESEDGETESRALPDNVDDFRAYLKEEAASAGEEFDLCDADVNELFQLMRDGACDTEESTMNRPEMSHAVNTMNTSNIEAREVVVSSSNVQEDLSTAVNDDPVRLMKIQELQQALPGMPLSRVKKVLRAFEQTLSYPSLLTLVPILRETMPEYITLGWLKRTNSRTAEFVLQRASDDDLVDPGILNSMLQVKANAGSLHETLQFHLEAFSNHRLVRERNRFLESDFSNSSDFYRDVASF